jgi:general secretion pathway protein A
MQIVLIGQPELERILNQYELRQLKQRIAIYSTISPLTEAESLEYIKFRLTQATRVKTPVFTKGAAMEIIRAAKGIPRSINIISDNALITGFGARRKPVTSKIVREVILDLEPRAKPRFRWAFAVLGAMVLILAAAALLWPDTLLDNALTVARLPIQQIEKLVRTEPPPSADTAKPDLASRAKRTADVGLKGQVPVQPTVPPEGHASGSNTQALPTVRLEKEIDKVVPEERPAAPPPPDVRVDAIAPGVSADTKDKSVAIKPEARVDAGKDFPRDTHSAQPVDSPRALQPVSPGPDPAADFPKPAPEAKSPVLQQATVVRTARKGDSLIRIAAEVYDLSSEEVCKRGLIDSVSQLNPQIHDVNKIEIGEKILFPPLKVPGKTEDKAD